MGNERSLQNCPGGLDFITLTAARRHLARHSPSSALPGTFSRLRGEEHLPQRCRSLFTPPSRRRGTAEPSVPPRPVHGERVAEQSGGGVRGFAVGGPVVPRRNVFTINPPELYSRPPN